MKLIAGSVGHRLLSVASAEPQPLRHLVTVLDGRGVGAGAACNLSDRMRQLLAEGFVTRVGRGRQGHPYLYTLTRAGEDELDRLAGEQ